MRDISTKLRIMAGLLGTVAFGATDTALAKSQHIARGVEKFPYNYTCQSSSFYPGYYCYEPGPYFNWSYNWYTSHYAYAAYDSYGCATAVWKGWRWVRGRVC
jgi:hypothetical protein